MTCPTLLDCTLQLAQLHARCCLLACVSPHTDQDAHHSTCSRADTQHSTAQAIREAGSRVTRSLSRIEAQCRRTGQGAACGSSPAVDLDPVLSSLYLTFFSHSTTRTLILEPRRHALFLQLTLVVGTHYRAAHRYPPGSIPVCSVNTLTAPGP